jgi:hypothetical protein
MRYILATRANCRARAGCASRPAGPAKSGAGLIVPGRAGTGAQVKKSGPSAVGAARGSRSRAVLAAEVAQHTELIGSVGDRAARADAVARVHGLDVVQVRRVAVPHPVIPRRDVDENIIRACCQRFRCCVENEVHAFAGCVVKGIDACVEIGRVACDK